MTSPAFSDYQLEIYLAGLQGVLPPRDLAASNFPQLRGHCLANYTTDPVFRALLGQDPDRDPAATVGRWAGLFGNTPACPRPVLPHQGASRYQLAQK
jgi:hypothetical protein